MAFQKAATVQEIAAGQGKQVTVSGKAIALFNVAGAFYAILAKQATSELTSSASVVNYSAGQGFAVPDAWTADEFNPFGDPLGREQAAEPTSAQIAQNDLPEKGGAVAIDVDGPSTKSENAVAAGPQNQTESSPVLPGDVPETDGPGVAMASSAPASASTPPTPTRYGQHPLTFEPNQGQTGATAQYLARGLGHNFFLSATDATLALQRRVGPAGSSQRAVLRMQLVGANPLAPAQAQEQQPGRSNYIRGRNPATWRTNVPNFAKVRYSNVYPSIDTIYYGTTQRQIEFDFIVRPGGNPGVIRLAYPGVSTPRLDAQGRLVLSTAGGDVLQRAPVLYQLQGTTRQPVAGRYLLTGGQIGFQITGSYDPTRVLYIDPVVDYSSYLGGSQDDSGEGIAVESDGTAYVVGTTTSPDLPPPLISTYAGNGDAFVTKLDPNGIPVFTTYFGGGAEDSGQGIALVPNGNEFLITGTTRSSDLPLAGVPYQGFLRGVSDAYAARLKNSDGTPIYITYLGGDGEETGKSIAADGSGRAYLAGITKSSNFPTTFGGFQSTTGGGDDAFVARLNASGSALDYASYLGGSGTDEAWSIAVDIAGNAYLGGKTDSPNFPNPGALQPYKGAGTDAFVTKVASGGASLVFSTFYGGDGNDEGHGLAIDASRNIYLAGVKHRPTWLRWIPSKRRMRGVMMLLC